MIRHFNDVVIGDGGGGHRGLGGAVGGTLDFGKGEDEWLAFMQMDHGQFGGAAVEPRVLDGAVKLHFDQHSARFNVPQKEGSAPIRG